MSDSLVVLLEDEVAGVLQRLPGGRLRFDYEAAYQERPSPTPLSLSLPVQVSSHSDGVVSPWLWGLLPDNREVLRRWGRAFEVPSNSAFALLGTPVGEDCPGAVRFSSPEAVEAALGRQGEVAWLDEDEVAAELRLRGAGVGRALRRRADLELADRRHRRPRQELLPAPLRRSGPPGAAL